MDKDTKQLIGLVVILIIVLIWVALSDVQSAGGAEATSIPAPEGRGADAAERDVKVSKMEAVELYRSGGE